MKARASVRSAWFLTLALAAIVAMTAAPVWSQQGYRRPAKEILDILDSTATPSVSLSPARDRVLMAEPLRYPPIADLAQPMLRLAGLRLNPATNGPARPQRFRNFVLKNLSDGRETPVQIPAGVNAGFPSWAPDGKQFYFVNTTGTGLELWIGNPQTGAVHRINNIQLNGVLGSPCSWMPDSRTLLCRLVPAGRGKPPDRPLAPNGPNIQESFGRPAPVRTFQDLLTDPHDEKLFDYYATAQLALVETTSGRATPVGKPGVIGGVSIAPNGEFFLVGSILRPYSYLVPLFAFPNTTQVWDRSGKMIYRVASQPLADNIPIGGVQTGPRNINWHPLDPATLVWVEALDGGNPRTTVPHRDRIVWLKAPFSGQPAEITKTEHRYAGITWGERGDLAVIRDSDRRTLRVRAWFFDPRNLSEPFRLVWDRSAQDRYGNPGAPELKRLPTGHIAMLQHGDFIYLTGPGASPEGDRPFLDRFNVKTLEAERLFHSDAQSYESVTDLLVPDASRFLTRRETLTDPPNYFIRTAAGQSRAFTTFPDPAPQLRGIQKELVTYKRADGVDLSFTLYLPPDYKKGERRPAVIWAYPREFTDASVAGQVSGSPNRFVSIGGISHLFFLLAGYVVLDNAAMPVVGDPETVNNTYVEQIVSSSQAAIDKAAEMGVIDPNRVGVGGHSYGAFMTANLLAHSDIFRAGIARSGAYNRTLTPFGFQSERRTLWEAAETYLKMSPFLYAHKIKEPVLLIHGEADNNSGTFPIQSERMYHAIKGNGGSVRYVTLPHESHGYAARESVEHTLWEMINWFDQHVKNPGRPARADESAANKR
ncbi:MAG TPA: prolyl oligopeptidase family serine peptidase [Candidatus Acidoferrales bacterium]